MDETADMLISRVDALPREERAKLAAHLIRSFDDDYPDSDVEDAWIEELNRRAADIESGQDKGVPAEDVFRRLREKFG